ncbi:unnamed protein product [Rotaria socialis]|uniref:Alkaline phosphatase, tissue-nonspecific isozyme n=2 Tax=Rotaria socialis TaxID=392032 RepID=A0A818A5Z4_9BILA|nr:unnamed protein product [Rotaria socialis]
MFSSTKHMYHFLVILVIVASNLNIDAGRTDWSEEKNPSFWNEQARLDIEYNIRRTENKRTAKNVIFFLGDGMGISTVTAGRIRKGQMLGQLGEDFITEMEQFSHLGLAKTYCTDHQTSDSAATATALFCGVKAALGTIGLDGRALRRNCSSSHGHHANSIFEWAQQLGYHIGIVVTSRVSHASPASGYAHSPERNWEGYDSINFGAKQVAEGCVDIAQQLVLRSPPIDLVLGGGRRFFYPTQTPDIANSSLRGARTDNVSLIDDIWKGRFIWNKTDLHKIELGSSAPILGLFHYDQMRFETDRIQDPKEEPSLSEMATFAVKHLLQKSQDKNGFFLFVEGSRIDHAHHYTQPRYALDDYVEFDNTIGQIKRILQDEGVLDDTLLVVTSDHSNAFSFGAGAARGSNIFGFGTLENANVSSIDKMPVNIIAYGNGPNFASNRNKTYLDSLDFNQTGYRAPAALPMSEASHAGEDVAVFAQGPWSHLFIGVMEQSTIAHKMAYAACWGDYQKRKGCA